MESLQVSFLLGASAPAFSSGEIDRLVRFRPGRDANVRVDAVRDLQQRQRVRLGREGGGGGHSVSSAAADAVFFFPLFFLLRRQQRPPFQRLEGDPRRLRVPHLDKRVRLAFAFKRRDFGDAETVPAEDAADRGRGESLARG